MQNSKDKGDLACFNAPIMTNPETSTDTDYGVSLERARQSAISVAEMRQNACFEWMMNGSGKIQKLAPLDGAANVLTRHVGLLPELIPILCHSALNFWRECSSKSDRRHHQPVTRQGQRDHIHSQETMSE